LLQFQHFLEPLALHLFAAKNALAPGMQIALGTHGTSGTHVEMSDSAKRVASAWQKPIVLGFREALRDEQQRLWLIAWRRWTFITYGRSNISQKRRNMHTQVLMRAPKCNCELEATSA
jgi:hypothetical protein